MAMPVVSAIGGTVIWFPLTRNVTLPMGFEGVPVRTSIPDP
jgi:hypothetical protein